MKALERTIIAALLALASIGAHAKDPLVDCDVLGRFATQSLMNRLIGVPYQPTAGNMYLAEGKWTERKTTLYYEGPIFFDAYKERSLHVTPDAFGEEIKQHCLKGEFLK